MDGVHENEKIQMRARKGREGRGGQNKPERKGGGGVIAPFTNRAPFCVQSSLCFMLAVCVCIMLDPGGLWVMHELPHCLMSKDTQMG